jgi:hypothetical protein
MTGVDGASSRDVDGGMTMLTFLTLVVVVGTNITSQSQLYSDMASCEAARTKLQQQLSLDLQNTYRFAMVTPAIVVSAVCTQTSQ